MLKASAGRIPSSLVPQTPFINSVIYLHQRALMDIYLILWIIILYYFYFVTPIVSA